MYTLTINKIRFVIQAYDKNDYVNLSPIQDGIATPFNEKIGNIRILFHNNSIKTEGKETAFYKKFISELNIDDVINEGHKIMNKPITRKQEYDKGAIIYNKGVLIGDNIEFYTCCNSDRQKYIGVVEYKEQLGYFVMIDNVMYEVRKMIDIKILW